MNALSMAGVPVLRTSEAGCAPRPCSVIRQYSCAVALAVAGVSSGCNAERSAWADAQADESVEAYERFLSDHPAGAYADSARNRLEAAVWQDVENSPTRGQYVEFFDRFPESAFQPEAWARSRLFAVEPVALGTAGTRTGPVVSIRPQWDSLETRLDAANVFATTSTGDTVRLERFAPVNLGSNVARPRVVNPTSDETGVTQWTPKSGTLGRRYAVLSGYNGQLTLELEFTSAAPMVIAFLFDGDFTDLDGGAIHVLGRSIPVESFSDELDP